MRKEGYCAYGAARLTEQVRSLQAKMESLEPESLPAVVETLAQAHQLQTCLSLFRGCYPKTRVACAKRRLRRLLRALNALHDTLRLIQVIESLAPPPEYRAGVRRALLRLRQHAAKQRQTLQRAWVQWLESRLPNEILGLSRRWIESFAQEPCDVDYLRQQWDRFYREQVSALAEGTAQSLAVRGGRLRAILEAAAILQPLGLETPCIDRVATVYRQMEAQRFQARAQAMLQQLLQEERERTRAFAGSLRGFGRIQAGIEWLMRMTAPPFPAE